jgi:membrane-bound inhibitor of C-type lysozyme
MSDFNQIRKLETLKHQPHKRAFDQGGFKQSNFIQHSTGKHYECGDKSLLVDVNDIADVSIRD